MSDLSGTPTSLGIGTFNTSVDPPSGLGFNEAMGQIDALIAQRVLKPSGVSAGDVPVWNGTTWVVPTGTRNGSKFLRDDGSWQTVTVPSTTPTTNAQTGTTYTLAIGDQDNIVELNNAAAIALTVPLHSSVPFGVDHTITLFQTGAGQVTVAGAGGVTVNGAPGLKLNGQWSVAQLIMRATDTWLLFGNITA